MSELPLHEKKVWVMAVTFDLNKFFQLFSLAECSIPKSDIIYNYKPVYEK